MQPFRLHTKTTLIVCAITVAMFLATLFVLSIQTANLVREDQKELTRYQAISLAEQISLSLVTHDQDILDQSVSQARRARPDVIAVRVWILTGGEWGVSAASTEGASAEDILPKEISATIPDRTGSTNRVSVSDFIIENERDTHYRVFAPVTGLDHLYGLVEVTQRLDKIPPIVKRFAQYGALLSLVAITLTMLAIYTLFRYLVYQPMNELEAAISNVKAGSLEVQIPVTTRDEFGRLAMGFNRMIRSIRELTQERESQQETLRERVREATAESLAAAERYRLIFESNPLPMWVYDTETLAFLTVNEAAVKDYGWSREVFLMMTIRDIFPVDDFPKFLDLLSSPDVERSQNYEWRHRRKDGTLINVEVFSHHLMYEGRNARLVIAADVTEKKRIEAGLLRSQRLESLGTLASGIAHDLNNILSPLTISTYLLRPKITDPGGQQTLDTMDEVIERGSQLVKQVLSFARGAEGERVHLNPKNVLGEVVGIIKETFPKSIRIHYNHSDASGKVLANPTQLHQVIMNLCLNARDAMPEGGDLEIKLEDVQLDKSSSQLLPDAKPGSYVRISVFDTGVGIPEQLIDKIFDPFFTTKEQGKGTGLGLSTSLGIVRSHGGFINIYSEPGTGTACKVYLPALDKSIEFAEQVEAPEPPAGKGEFILMVDDEEPIRRLTRSMLEAANYNVITASDGIEACQLYHENKDKIRIVLTDMMMPSMGGAAVIEELRRLNPQLPIIASSGLTEAGSDKHALSLGAQMFLSKPYTASRLLWALHRLLREGQHNADREDY